jgi:hypothetical protein
MASCQYSADSALKHPTLPKIEIHREESLAFGQDRPMTGVMIFDASRLSPADVPKGAISTHVISPRG